MTHPLTGLLIRCEHLPRHHLPRRQPGQELVAQNADGMVGSGLPAEEYKVHVSIQYLSSCNIFWAIKYRRWPPGISGGFSAGRWSRRRRSCARSATTTSTLATRCFLLLNRLTSHSLSLQVIIPPCHPSHAMHSGCLAPWLARSKHLTSIF